MTRLAAGFVATIVVFASGGAAARSLPASRPSSRPRARPTSGRALEIVVPSPSLKHDRAAANQRRDRLVPREVPKDPDWRRRLPAFDVKLAVDVPVAVFGGLMHFGWMISPTLAPPHCNPCDKDDLPGIDRAAAGNYDKGWARATDIMLYSMIGGTFLTVLIEEGLELKNFTHDAIVVFEAMAVANTLTIITALASRRPRPLMYGPEAYDSPNNALSFFSGHVATTTSLTLAAFIAARRRNPGEWWPWLVLGVGLAATAVVGTGRVLAGKHFPTDVIFGAAAGAASGLAVPLLHGDPAEAR